MWEAPGPGPWLQDRAHLPSAVTPLMQSAYPPGMQRGFTETLEPWGALLDTMNVVYVNGFAYMQPVPFDAPGPDGERSPEYLGAEIGRRTGLAAAAFEQRIWRDVLRALGRRGQARVDRATPRVGRRSTWPRSTTTGCSISSASGSVADRHGVSAPSIQRNGDAADGRLHPPRGAVDRAPAGADVRCLRRLVPGVRAWCRRSWRPRSTPCRPTPERRRCSRATRRPSERLAELRRRIPAVDEYLAGCGYRLAAGFDLTNPTIGERPDILLDRIRRQPRPRPRRGEAPRRQGCRRTPRPGARRAS